MAGLLDSSVTLTTPIRTDGSTLADLISRFEEQIANLRAIETRQDIPAAGGSIVIDLSLGEYVRLTLVRDVTQVVFANWMNPPLVSRLTLEVTNPGARTIDFGFAKWGGDGLFEIISSDAGKTVFGHILTTGSK